MRYAVISDLHANFQAWKAIHLDLRANRVDYTICLGDMVGYGPQPAEVLQAVYSEVDALVLGNHDAAICGKLDVSLFNPLAQASIRWTRAQLSRQAIRFLARLPLTLVGVGFRCAHGDFAAPAQFNYLLNPEDALPSWTTVDDPLLFCGHTHDPALFLLGPSGIPRGVPIQDFTVEAGKRYVINTGSVGHPRDGDPRASYCIYDAQTQSVFWRRVPFDLDAYRQALTEAKLDPTTAPFLNHDPRRERPAVRQLLCFSPPRTTAQAARNTVESQSLASLRRRGNVWRDIAVAALVVALAAAGYGWYELQRYRNRACVVPDPAPLSAPVHPIAGVNLLPQPGTPVTAGSACPGWRITLGNRYRQQVAVAIGAQGHPMFVLSSRAPNDELALSAPPVAVSPGMSVYPDALFLKARDFEGRVAMVVSLTRMTEKGEETLDQFYVKEPNQVRPDGWVRAKQKFEIPARCTRMQFHIRGTFRGHVSIKDFSLTTAAPAHAEHGPGNR